MRRTSTDPSAARGRRGKGGEAKARPLDRLQVLLGDDHVSVDIDQWHGGGDPAQLGEFFHKSSTS